MGGCPVTREGQVMTQPSPKDTGDVEAEQTASSPGIPGRRGFLRLPAGRGSHPENLESARRGSFPDWGDLPHDAQRVQGLLLRGLLFIITLLAWGGRPLSAFLLLEEVERLLLIPCPAVRVQDRDISAGEVCGPWGSGACEGAERGYLTPTDRGRGASLHLSSCART